jgi:hypothetical protein
MISLRQNSTINLGLVGTSVAENREVFHKAQVASTSQMAQVFDQVSVLHQIQQDYQQAKRKFFLDITTLNSWKNLQKEAKVARRGILPFDKEKLKTTNTKFAQKRVQFAKKHGLDFEQLKTIRINYTVQLAIQKQIKRIAPMTIVNVMVPSLPGGVCFRPPFGAVRENEVVWYNGPDGNGGSYQVTVDPRNNPGTGQFGAKVGSDARDSSSDFDLFNIVNYDSWYEFPYTMSATGTVEVKAQIRILRARQSVSVQDVEWEFSDASAYQFCSLFMRVNDNPDDETDFIELSRIDRNYDDVDDQGSITDSDVLSNISAEFIFHSPDAYVQNQVITISLGARLYNWLNQIDDVNVWSRMNFRFRLERLCITVV